MKSNDAAIPMASLATTTAGVATPDKDSETLYPPLVASSDNVGGDSMVRGHDGGDASTARVTPRLAFVIGWTILATYNFGFGTSELNPLQNVLICSGKDGIDCLPMTNAQFGYATAAFTVGGFVGSLGLSPLKTRVALIRTGKYALLLASLFYVLGGLVQSAATAWTVLAAGRFLMGLGSGVALVTVPGYLNDVAPPHLRGSVGVLNQLSIVIGILSAQALGISSLGDRPEVGQRAAWRTMPLISAAIAIVQIGLSPFALHAPSDVQESAAVQAKLWGLRRDVNDETEGLLAGDERVQRGQDEARNSSSGENTGSADESRSSCSIGDLLRVAAGQSITRLGNPRDLITLRRGVLLIIFTQIAQQVSGVNSVLYFSTGILAELFAGNGKNSGDMLARQISVGITFVNFAMTFPPIPLVQEQRLGRRRLLQISAATMAVAALVLGISLLNESALLAAISILFFAAGFSLGLGPVPFLILPELVPREAVAAASSLGIACNWLANITLASAFLPVKEALSRIDGHNGGSVFFIFVAIDAIILLGVTRYYVYKEQ